MLAYASPGSTFLGILAGIIGLILSTVGFDPTTDVSRFTFEIASLQAGLGLVPAAVGIFGIAEVLQNIEHSGPRLKVVTEINRILPPWSEIKRLWPICIRGSLIGVFVGAIPAAGSAIAVSVSYAQEKRMSKNPERFGTGIPEGIVAPESANNSCVGGALIPMITLGIPGDSMTAVLIGALLIHGLRPGPDMFRAHIDFVATVYVSLIMAVVVTLALGLYGNRYFARVLQLPRPVLLTAVVLLCIIGSFAVRNSMFDVVVMLGFGVAGYLMNWVGMPTAPVIFGMVLGPLLEDNIRRSLILYGDWSIFIKRPISLLLILLSIAALVYPLVQTLWQRSASKMG